MLKIFNDNDFINISNIYRIDYIKPINKGATRFGYINPDNIPNEVKYPSHQGQHHHGQRVRFTRMI